MRKSKFVQRLAGERLPGAFKHHAEVVAAYLYGSVAEGVAHSRSDVDIAVLLDESFDLKRSLEYRIELAEELSQLLEREVDVVVLNEAPVLLQFQVIRCRRILYERDAERRALFEMRVMGDYYDYERYFDFFARELRDALKRGELGVRETSH
jgi:hypothetical protein